MRCGEKWGILWPREHEGGPLLFTGTYEHSIDSKNRLAIPAPIRASIQRSVGVGEGDPLFLYVTLGEHQSLWVYTKPEFEQLAAELKRSRRNVREVVDYELIFFSLAQEVELDRQGRIRLPEHLLRRTGMPSEVVLLGASDHLVIRDRQAWQRQLDQALESEPACLNPRVLLDLDRHDERDEPQRP